MKLKELTKIEDLKQSLQRLSTDELISLASEKKLYIPSELGRNFIIGELLENAREEEHYDESSMMQIAYDENLESEQLTLPTTYDTTEIRILRRDPTCIFAYWDINSKLLKAVTNSQGESIFVLRVQIKKHDETDYYDIEIDENDRKRYILLSSDETTLRVDFCVRDQEGIVVIAQSNELEFDRSVMTSRLSSDVQNLSSVLLHSSFMPTRSYHLKKYRSLL